MSDADFPPGARRTIRRAAAATAVVAVAATAAWWVTRPAPATLFKQGMAAMRRDPATGERFFRRAIDAADGEYADAEMGLCLALARQGAWDEAEAHFQAVDKSSCRSDLLTDFGRLALKAGHRAEGLAALEAAGERPGAESAQALELLMDEYRSEGRQDDVIATARRLTKLEPDDRQHWVVLIALLKATFRETECLEAIRQALEHHPPAEFENEFRHRLVQQLIIAGDFTAAWKELAKLPVEEGPPRIWSYQVDLYRLEGRPETALDVIESAFPGIRDLPAAWYMRGVVKLDLGRIEEAAHDLEHAVKAAPFNALGQFKLSEAYRLLGRDEPARTHRDLGNEISESRRQINQLLKEAHVRRNDRRFCERLASLYEKIGESETAQSWHEKASAARGGP
jgi:tetratricopeptide (TPR) repeat protein